MNYNNFKRCKSKSDLYEAANMHRMELLGWEIIDKAPEGIVTDGSHKAWADFDFIVQKDGHRFNIEQKVDYVSWRTGNITVEFADGFGNVKGIFKGDGQDVIQYILPNEDETAWHLLAMKRQTMQRLTLAYRSRVLAGAEGNDFYYLVKIQELVKHPGVQYKPIELQF